MARIKNKPPATERKSNRVKNKTKENNTENDNKPTSTGEELDVSFQTAFDTYINTSNKLTEENILKSRLLQKKFYEERIGLFANFIKHYEKKSIAKKQTFAVLSQEDIRGLVEEIKTFDSNGVETASVKFKLMEHQLYGISWLYYYGTLGLNLLLGDEPGVGKTYQIIGLLTYLDGIGDTGKNLLVVPLITYENWLNEFKKISPKYLTEKVIFIHDNVNSISNEKFLSFQTIVITYEDLNLKIAGNKNRPTREYKLYAYIKRIKWKYLILDEAHKLKTGGKTISFNAVKKEVDHELLILLTGTPIQNSIDELWNIFELLIPTIFSVNIGGNVDGNVDENDIKVRLSNFKKVFDVETVIQDENPDKYLEALDFLRSILDLVMLQRTFDEISQLKGFKNVKIEKLVKVRVSPQMITDDQTYMKDAKVTPDEEGVDLQDNEEVDTEPTKKKSKEVYVKRQEIYTHPLVFQCKSLKDLNTAVENATVEELLDSSNKIKMLILLIDNIINKDLYNKVLIFVFSLNTLRLISLILKKMSINSVFISGELNPLEKNKAIKEFNTDSSVRVFIITTGSASVGINLQRANYGIIVDLSWNPSNDIQAIGRLWRGDQSKNVIIIKLLNDCEFEERKFNSIQKKLIQSKILLTIAKPINLDDDAESLKNRREEQKKLLNTLLVGYDYLYYVPDNYLEDYITLIISETHREDIVKNVDPAKAIDRSNIINEFFKVRREMDRKKPADKRKKIETDIKKEPNAPESDESSVEDGGDENDTERKKRKRKPLALKVYKPFQFIDNDAAIKIGLIIDQILDKQDELDMLNDDDDDGNHEEIITKNVNKPITGLEQSVVFTIKTEAIDKLNNDINALLNGRTSIDELKVEYDNIINKGFSKMKTKLFKKYLRCYISHKSNPAINIANMFKTLNLGKKTDMDAYITQYHAKFIDENDPQSNDVRLTYQKQIKEIEKIMKKEELNKSTLEKFILRFNGKEFTDLKINYGNLNNNGYLYSEDMDRIILCLYNKCEPENWKQLKYCIYYYPPLKTNWFIRSRSVDQIKERYEFLFSIISTAQ